MDYNEKGELMVVTLRGLALFRLLHFRIRAVFNIQ